MEQSEKLLSLLRQVIREDTLKKIVLSRPLDRSVLRAECRRIALKDGPRLQLETFTADGKAYHRNFTQEEAAEALLAVFDGYRQMNILTTGGDAEAKRSSKGKLTVLGDPKGGERVAPAPHDRRKKHILSEGTPCDFLIALGVCDPDGRVYDRKRSKFRQIDRFLQYIEEIFPRLPQEGVLEVLDLCCGKSYLTFAAYWYLTVVKGREVSMIGADRKPDVIGFCSALAERLGWQGLTFRCCDVSTFLPERKPALVLSLHACDIATDIVLTAAARLEADVILATPCCQHQLFSQVDLTSPLGRQLAPILEHSLLKQKFCVALTDALRCKRLRASGYAVDVTELIDPEDTPKNLMIRAVRTPMSREEREEALAEFRALQALCGTSLFGGEPTL